MPLECTVWNRINRHFGNLTDRDAGHVRFIYFYFGLNDRHVGDRHQDSPLIVHRSNDDSFTFVDVPPGHEAVDR